MTRILIIPLLLVLTILLASPKWLLAQTPAIDLDRLLWAIGEAETGDLKTDEARNNFVHPDSGAVGWYQVKPATALDRARFHHWRGEIDLKVYGTNWQFARWWLVACIKVVRENVGWPSIRHIAWCYMDGTLALPRYSPYVDDVVAHYEGQHIELAGR